MTEKLTRPAVVIPTKAQRDMLRLHASRLGQAELENMSNGNMEAGRDIETTIIDEEIKSRLRRR